MVRDGCAYTLAKKMRRKILQHYADVLCHMAIGWRMGDDLEVLSDLSDGTIHFNILEGEAIHDIEGDIKLHISDEMNTWLRDRLSKDQVLVSAIESVTLDLQMKTGRIKTDKKRVVSFDWRCHSRIKTEEKVYEVKHVDRHAWYSRKKPEEQILMNGWTFTFTIK